MSDEWMRWTSVGEWQARCVLCGFHVFVGADATIEDHERTCVRRTCAGPVYFGDQGIEWCHACNGCVCCDAENVDHSGAEYECFRDRSGPCCLKAHAGRPCQLKSTSGEGG